MLGRSINGEMVLLARRRRRKTQVELSSESGIPQTTLSRLENGTRQELTSDQVQALVRVLNFPAAFFHEQEQLYRSPISLHSAAFRKRASVSAKDSEAVVALGNHYIIQLRKLLDSVDLESQFELLQFEVVSFRDGAGEHARAVTNAAEAATAVRSSWQVGAAPLASLTRYVEATGIAIIHADFGLADIDGFTLRPVGMRPIIFLNKSRSADRIRFSLAHEYGHAVLHPFPYESMEKEANEFAAELLMPAEAILPDLKRGLSIPALGKLKLKWGVSIASLLYRARSLGVIDPEGASHLWRGMMAPYRTREPQEYDLNPEPTKLINDLVGMHLTELGYRLADVAHSVMTSPDEFAEMFGIAPDNSSKPGRPRLRLVSSTG